MQTKNLVKIIKAEAIILTDLIDGLSADGEVSPYEIELIINKIQVLNNALNHLVPGHIDEKTEKLTPSQIKTEPVVIKEPVTEPVFPPKNEPKQELKAEPEIIEPIIPQVIEEIIEEIPAEKPDSKLVQMTENLESVLPEKPRETKVLIKKEPIRETKKDAPSVEPVDPKGTLADKYQHEALSLNEMMAGIKKNHDLASKFNLQPITDLKKSIKINDRVRFINELFKKDTGLYDQTISAINKADNLDDALALIFEKFKWDQENETTIHFLELVFRRFQNS